MYIFPEIWPPQLQFSMDTKFSLYLFCLNFFWKYGRAPSSMSCGKTGGPKAGGAVSSRVFDFCHGCCLET